ncbi:MAG: hypothetical protein H6739_12465 [Alphaproteobacteria bacterium]|nr:hypothetical protein [Alphaproteobacteria bacterium]
MRFDPRLPLAAAILGLVGLGAACEPADPCDEYVDYICTCHAEDDRPGYDCETLRITYQNANPELQDDCQVSLDDQVDQDAEEGFQCAGDTGL